MNVPAWPCTTTSRRSWLGLPSSYRASTQQPLISSFHNGYDSKSATIAMIDSAGAATSTVLLTNGIGRAYPLRHPRLFEQHRMGSGIGAGLRVVRSVYWPAASQSRRASALTGHRAGSRDAFATQGRNDE